MQDSDSTLHDVTGEKAQPPPADGRLWVIASPDRERVGASFRLDPDAPFLLGRRVERGGLSLEDPRMSRVHARLGWDGRSGAFRLADAGSANGVYVDGTRVTAGSVKLSSGSVLRMGGTVFVLREHDVVAALDARVERVAPVDLSVLLTGESGTGKERLARQLHEQSGRRGPFVAINCAAVPRDLLASELFGHVKGAFSGAGAERTGVFRAAQGGTLLLDEIGDMPLDAQPALLRALEVRAVRPVGSEREVPCDVRVVAATHRDLKGLVARGEFRLDLLARLAQVELVTPSLRERSHRLPELLNALAGRLGIELEVTWAAMEALALARLSHNVRELLSLLQRLSVFADPPFRLDTAFLEQEAPQLLTKAPVTEPPAPQEGNAEATQVTREQMAASLARHDGRVIEVARELGTSRTQVYRWLKRLGLETPSAR